MHERTRYAIDQSRCTFCGGCASVCPSQAILIHDHRSDITDRCSRCGNCFRFCPVDAVEEAGEGAAA